MSDGFEKQRKSVGAPASLGQVEIDAELRRAVALQQRGHLAEAESSCRAILDVAPDHFDAQHLLGILMQIQGRNVEALQWIGGALQKKPGDRLAISNYGAILGRLNRFTEALTILNEAISLQPDNATAFYNRGVVLQGLNRLDEALASYERAIALNPQYPEALNNQGIAFKELRRFEEALGSFDKAVALRPNYAEAHNNRGIILQEMNRPNDALASYDKAIGIVSTFAEAFNNKGNTLQKLERFEEALSSYKTAITLNPKYVDAYNNQGNALKQLGRLGEAMAAFDKAMCFGSDNSEVFNNRGAALQELKRFDEALADFERAIALKPNSAEAHNNRGNVLKELDHFEEALTSYETAIRLAPDYAEAFNNRAIGLMELGRMPEAKQSAERAVHLAPRQPRYYHTLGNITRYAADASHVAVMEELARNLATLSSDERVELHFALAKAYDDLGRPRDSFEQLLAGNALKRQQIVYDEAKALDDIDRTQAVFTPEFISGWSNAGNRSAIPVFIVGMPRSGSTLVEQILASHPQIFGGGELKHFSRTVEEVRSARFGGSAENPSAASAAIAQDFWALGDGYVAKIGRLAPDAARITDKMTGNFNLAGLIHLALPNSVIIHTVRDPVDTCLSCFSKLFAEGALNYTYNLGELGRYYRHYRALMEHWYRVLPPQRILDVQYEEVVADLEGQARRIIAHTGLNWDPRCLSFHRTERPIRTLSATQVRQPLYKSAVGRRHAYEAFLEPLLTELNAP